MGKVGLGRLHVRPEGREVATALLVIERVRLEGVELDAQQVRVVDHGGWLPKC